MFKHHFIREIVHDHHTHFFICTDPTLWGARGCHYLWPLSSTQPGLEEIGKSLTPDPSDGLIWWGAAQSAPSHLLLTERRVSLTTCEIVCVYVCLERKREREREIERETEKSRDWDRSLQKERVTDRGRKRKERCIFQVLLLTFELQILS